MFYIIRNGLVEAPPAGALDAAVGCGGRLPNGLAPIPKPPSCGNRFGVAVVVVVVVAACIYGCVVAGATISGCARPPPVRLGCRRVGVVETGAVWPNEGNMDCC